MLDFGACRGYEKSFMDKYIEIIYAASEGDRNKILNLSREMGFLTGYESKVWYVYFLIVLALGKIIILTFIHLLHCINFSLWKKLM